ncbi:sigma factor G inhibitor Gin [Clostridium sp. DJ247]|uniref:sigma factor G inhibitor Gin n=1 Tax=Clostridium sp. DJ247 TaxID=2726188 RepID=UPI001626DD5C|nr:sigma factor G inhibitor Gin [Clostridium sp. DJ247]MBC2581242.1 sigma factor G inhibitor Gin [Clostridium sp. DJ247]
MKKQSCIICGKPLNNGIIIYGRRICKSCEERVINSDVNTDFYSYYKDCIRKSIVQSVIRGEEINCQNYHL